MGWDALLVMLTGGLIMAVPTGAITYTLMFRFSQPCAVNDGASTCSTTTVPKAETEFTPVHDCNRPNTSNRSAPLRHPHPCISDFVCAGGTRPLAVAASPSMALARKVFFLHDIRRVIRYIDCIHIS
jgi:hypothetical protein